MARKNRTPEENERRTKIRELLQSSNISSMDDIQDQFKETIAEFMENTAGIKVTASAVSQRRTQIDLAVFRAVFTSFNDYCTDGAFFHDYRVLAVDGTAVNLPGNPASPSFVCNDDILKGVNQLHATPLTERLLMWLTVALRATIS